MPSRTAKQHLWRLLAALGGPPGTNRHHVPPSRAFHKLPKPPESTPRRHLVPVKRHVVQVNRHEVPPRCMREVHSARHHMPPNRHHMPPNRHHVPPNRHQMPVRPARRAP
ncbi:hypothetical protein FHT26_002672 [Rhizobacter sp. SG703]|nr:hypothetical protein [Rhizobacter sp. SG703]